MKKIEIKFWGVRGSITTHHPKQNKYGGHTPCVSIHCGDKVYICDGGTGLPFLGNQLVKNRQEIFLLLSHLHWDHIFGIPFFKPVFQKERKIHLYGPKYQNESFKKTFERIMHPPYFPITPKEWSAETTWRDLKEGLIRVGEMKVSIRQVSHRDLTYGFQFITPNDRRIIYVTDHQLDLNDIGFKEWIHKADLLIHDTHFDRTRPKELLWGHSRFEEIAELAMLKNIKKMVFFHHNPIVSDAILEKRLKFCQNRAKKLKSKTQFWIAEEGKTLKI